MDSHQTSHESRGVQAYRWLVGAAVALILALSWNVFTGVNETSKAVNALQIQVSTMTGTLDSRLNAQAARIDSHDRRFDRIEDRVFAPNRNP